MASHQETKFIKPINNPSIGNIRRVMYDGELTQAHIFEVREYNGMQKYGMVYPPNSRPFTKVSVFKIKNGN